MPAKCSVSRSPHAYVSEGKWRVTSACAFSAGKLLDSPNKLSAISSEDSSKEEVLIINKPGVRELTVVTTSDREGEPPEIDSALGLDTKVKQFSRLHTCKTALHESPQKRGRATMHSQRAEGERVRACWGVSTSVCPSARTHARTPARHAPCIFVYVCVCMYAQQPYVYICIRIGICICVYACMYVCMHACMHACMYVCMYTHTHTWTHAHIRCHTCTKSDVHQRRGPHWRTELRGSFSTAHFSLSS